MKGDEQATCRGCGRALKGHAYWTGKLAYIPETNEQARANFYGGWVCSRDCDVRASLELEQTMPGHGYGQQTPGCFAMERIRRNWGS